MVDQDLPFHETMRNPALVGDEEIAAPTPTQNFVDTHETPINSPFPAGPVLFMVDQTLPFQDSYKVSGCVADALWVLDPTAAQKLADTQETPSSSENLADVDAGLTIDHLPFGGCVAVIEAMVVDVVVVVELDSLVVDLLLGIMVVVLDSPEVEGESVVEVPAEGDARAFLCSNDLCEGAKCLPGA